MAPRPTQNLGMKYFLPRLAGARVDVLEELPGAVPKQFAMGAVLLTTAGFAAASAAYALSLTGVASGFVCVLIGLVWGLVILNLDRMLILGLASETDSRKTLMLAVPRVILAFIIGVVISTPLMLKVFDTEISAQLNKNILSSQEALRSEINGSSANADLAAAEEKLTDLRLLINAGPTANPAANPKVKDVQAQIDKLEATATEQKAEADRLRAAAVAEEEGSAGTGVAGCAAMCVEKRRLASEAEGRWQGTQGEIAAKEREIETIAQGLQGSLLEESKKSIEVAQTELPVVEANVAQMREQIRSAQDGSYALEQANTGIIARLKALSDLTAGDSSAAMAKWMVSLLFMSIEILPVLFKVLSNFGSRTPYDELVSERENEEKERATAAADKRKEVESLRTEAELDADKERITGQQEAITKINEAVVKHQSEVVEQALCQWSQHAKRVSARRLESWSNDLDNPHAGTGKHFGPSFDESTSNSEGWTATNAGAGANLPHPDTLSSSPSTW